MAGWESRSDLLRCVLGLAVTTGHPPSPFHLVSLILRLKVVVLTMYLQGHLPLPPSLMDMTLPPGVIYQETRSTQFQLSRWILSLECKSAAHLSRPGWSTVFWSRLRVLSLGPVLLLCSEGGQASVQTVSDSKDLSVVTGVTLSLSLLHGSAVLAVSKCLLNQIRLIIWLLCIVKCDGDDSLEHEMRLLFIISQNFQI